MQGILPLLLVAGLCRAAEPVEFSFKDPAGRTVKPLVQDDRRFTVLFFLTTDCPVGNRYAPEIARLAEDYGKRGVKCYAVYAGEPAVEVRQHLETHGLKLPAVLDPMCQLARLTGATVTPEACVLSPDREILYRGRIDDRAVKLGTMRPEARTPDLRLALDAVLAGRPVAEKFTRAIGCYITFPDPVKPR